MGILSRIFRKKEEIEIPIEPVSKDLGMAGRRALATDFEPMEEPGNFRDKNDLILTKLDMISIRLDNLDRRIQYIEKIARESEK